MNIINYYKYRLIKNVFYILNNCLYFYGNLLVDEKRGLSKFNDFERDKDNWPKYRLGRNTWKVDKYNEDIVFKEGGSYDWIRWNI